MQQLKKQIRMACYLVIILILIFKNGYSQPRPFLWRGNLKNEIDHYNQSRKAYMDQDFPNQPNNFLLKGWLDMIAYFDATYPNWTCLRVYLCAYTNGSYVPSGMENKLVLVFSPSVVLNNGTTLTNHDFGYFYFPDSQPFDRNNITHFKIDDPIVIANWAKNYGDHFNIHLSAHIAHNNDNLNSTGSWSDTRAVSYCKRDLDELINEIGYQHHKGGILIPFSKDINISLASFKVNAILTHDIKDRLFLALDFTDTSDSIVHIDDMDEWGKRDSATNEIECNDCKLILSTLSKKSRSPRYQGTLDNGQLCPPASNCPN